MCLQTRKLLLYYERIYLNYHRMYYNNDLDADIQLKI